MAHDPATVVPYLYNSSAGVLGAGLLGHPLWDAIGASHVDHTICAASTGRAWAMTFGSMPGADLFDVVHAQLVVVWGANPAISNTHFPPLVNHARTNGAAVVVVDPRRTAMAKRADLHLAVRPGTDVVLALAVARELAQRRAVDLDFTDAHAAGVEEYLAAAQPWTAGARRRGVRSRAGRHRAPSSISSSIAARRSGARAGGWSATATGARPSGPCSPCPCSPGRSVSSGPGVHLHTGHDLSWDHAALCDGVLGKAGKPGSLERGRVRRHVNMNLLGQLLVDPGAEPAIDVLFVQGANPAAMNPAQAKVLAGLAREDLFTVVHDQVLTDTARYADVVLPATTHFERRDVAVPYGAFVTQDLAPVIDRVGESWTNDEVNAGLAGRLGFATGPGDAFDPTPERVLALALPGGVSPSASTQAPGSAVQFRDVWPDHPEARARLVASAGAQAHGVPPVPRYVELDAALPLTLVTPATAKTINSIFGDTDGPAPVVRLHPDDAERRGLHDGQQVRVWNADGEIEVALVVDADLRPGVASMPKGLWRRSVGGGFTANVFAPDTLNDLAGGACFNDARVDVAPALA